MDLAHFWNTSGAYQINQSLRFNSADSANCSRVFSSSGSLTTWTWSAWVKRSSFGGYQRLFGTGDNNSNSNQTSINFSLDALDFYNVNGGSKTSSALFRDPSAWYHVVATWDTTNSTAADRMRIYVNGSRITTFSNSSDPSPSTNSVVNSAGSHSIGTLPINSGNYFNGYLAEVNFIDGTALTPSSFGETDTITGAWIPKKYSGSYGTNGFYLKFEGSGIGTDSSGNGNNWTANNFSTSGTGTDVMSDTPTNNWCTLNPLDNGGLTLANGNLQATHNTSNWRTVRATFGITSGKWYWEITSPDATTSSSPYQSIMVGLAKSTATLTNYAGADSSGWSYFNFDGTKYTNGTSSAYGSSWSSANTIGIAFDADNGTLTFYRDNTSQGTAFTALTSGPYFPAVSCYNPVTAVFNFGQRGAFAYTPPTGFKALNTANLPEPTIKKGGAHFNTVLWTGNDVNGRTITGAGFQPDLVWIKSRSNAFNHLLNDAVRGTSGSDGKTLNSNTTAIESNDNNGFVSAFTSDGFTLSSGTSGPNPLTNVNKSPYTYAAWNWKANGAGSSNTDGTITSTVSANPTAGFSIVTYTGNGTDGATVGHGLGVTPNMVIVKRRNVAQNWVVAHSGINISTQSLGLNLTTQATAFGDGWIDGWSSTTFTTNQGFADIVNVNANTGTYVAYCFSEVAGYSKFGSYTGNGSTDGPFVFCGFRPALVIIKRTDNIGNWEMLDNRRLGYNKDNYALRADLSNAEVARDFDILSNGFKIRQDSGLSNHNASGGTYIFAAFSETAFKYANAR